MNLYDEQGTTLHRLAVLLGAEAESGRIVRTALLALHRRGHRLVDPAERIEFLQEQVVHLARAVRPVEAPLVLAEVPDTRQSELLACLSSMPPRMSELLIVSHYLAVFGPALAAIMRMSVRGCNQRLEISLETLRAKAGDGFGADEPVSLDDLSQELTAALRSAARQVQAPGTDTLEGELASLAGNFHRTIGPRIVVLLTVAAILAGLVLAVATRPRPVATSVPSPVPATASASGTRVIPAQVRDIAVYYLGRNNGLLYREMRDLPSTENLAGSVVEAVLTLAPLDPDYRSAWGPGQVLEVSTAGDTVTIDLSAEAYAELESPEEAQMARDQMVYSLSAVMGDAHTAVFFRENGGQPPADFRSEGGFERAGTARVAPLQIISPRNQQHHATGRIRISGTVRQGVPAPSGSIIRIGTGNEVAQFEGRLTGAKDIDGQHVWAADVVLGVGQYDIRASTSWEQPPRAITENKAVRVD